MTKRNVAVTDIVGLAASLPTLRVFAAALLLAPLAACAAPLPAEPAGPAVPAVQQTAPAPAPEAVPAPPAAAPAPAAQEPATTPRRPGETTTSRPPAPARPAPSTTTTNTAPVPAPLPADQAPAPAPAAEAPVVVPAPVPSEQTPRAALPSSTSSPAAGSLMQTIAALALVLAVLAGLAWFLKRFAPKMMGGGNANLRLVGALNLGARERIMVVEVGDQWIVVGASPGRINALATMPRQEGVEGTATMASATPAAGSFSDWLKNTIDKRNAK